MNAYSASHVGFRSSHSIAWLICTLVIGVTATAWAQDPSITRQPTNQIVSLGDSVMFSVTATTTNGPLSYQWQFRPTTNDTKTDLPDATLRTLTHTNVTAAQAGLSSIIVSNAAGASVISDEAQLTVDTTFILCGKAQLGDDSFLQAAAHCATPLPIDYDSDGWPEVVRTLGLDRRRFAEK